MRLAVFALFFVSGAGSLVYQVVWVRMLVLVFGTSVFAVSTVLSAFMAGLALGSLYFGRLVDRRSNGLRIYAGLELLIGLSALLLVPLLPERTASTRPFTGSRRGTRICWPCSGSG